MAVGRGIAGSVTVSPEKQRHMQALADDRGKGLAKMQTVNRYLQAATPWHAR